MSTPKVVVLDIVGLSLEQVRNEEAAPHLSALLREGALASLTPVFPALTLPVQASLTTGVFPETHGVVANGFYFPESCRVSFWEQYASLVRAERIWDRLWNKRSAALFLQNTLHAGCEAVITPQPLHTHDGLVQWCYSKPAGLYESIAEKVGPFNLYSYWGPFASIESSRWIAGAALEVIRRMRPDLLFVYLPHLDYCLQKFGPGSPIILQELAQIDHEVGRIVEGVREGGLARETLFLVLSEYAFSPVCGDIPLNRILRDRGLLALRSIAGREYLDCELSAAFAMVDHQIAHVYVKEGFRRAVRNVLESTEGIDLVLDEGGKRQFRAGHGGAGDFIAVSARDRWFSYYWWEDSSREPDFACRVDIHRKPGYDPLELFMEPGSATVPQDTSLIKGSHGYPPLSEQDLVPFFISGPRAEEVSLPRSLSVTEVPGLIERILSGVG